MHAKANGPPAIHATLTALVPRLVSGTVGAETLLAQCRALIASHDRAGAGLSALLRLNEAATMDARSLDSARRDRGSAGPLHGIPFVLKDNIDMRGVPTTSGNRAMAGAVALSDAEATRRLRCAGAVILGKANLSEFSFEVRSRSSLGGDVRNAFDPAVTAGGSSGGTAAAVAAGFAVAGLGTDTGGSIRVPAAFNGLVGLRPTHGLLDLRGVAPLAPSTDTVGPIARCVEDVATILAILSGSPRSAWLTAEPGLRRGLQGARLGVLRQAFGTDAAIGSVIEAALAQMAGAGAILIDPVHLPDELLPIDRPLLVDWEFRPAFDAYLRDRFAPGTAPASLAEIVAGGEFLPDYRDALHRRLAAESPPCPAYLEVVAYHDRLRNALGAVMAQHRLDAIVHPTSMVLPTSLDNPATGWAPELAACCGWPALTVPAGRSARGLPIGVEFLGRAHTEAGLLAIGHAFESLRGGRAIPDLASAGH